MQQNLAHMDKNLTDLEHTAVPLEFYHFLTCFHGNKFSQKIEKGSLFGIEVIMTIVLEQYLLHSIASFKHISLVVHVTTANFIMLTMLLVGFLLECSLFYMAHWSCLPSFCQKFHQEWSKENPLKQKNQNKTTHFSICMNTFLYSKRIHWHQLPKAHNPSF